MNVHTALTTADAAEATSVQRYLRQRRFAGDVIEAVRRADAVNRLERALSQLPQRASGAPA